MTLIEWALIADKWAEPLVTFRDEIIIENGGTIEERKLTIDRATRMLRHEDLGQDRAEEIFKYSDIKWDETPFDHILTATSDNCVIAMSGARKMNRWLRVGMHLYVLKRARREHRSLYWREGGFLQQHVTYAREHGLDGIFMSVFAHNKHLRAFVRYMNETARTLSPHSPISPVIRDLIAHPEPVEINFVPQHIFYLTVKKGARIEEAL